MCILFGEREGIRYFLLLHRCLNWEGWEFVKGGVDKGEEPEEAAGREIAEETGLVKTMLVKKIPGRFGWSAGGKKYSYSVLVFRAGMDERVKLQAEPVKEHDAFEWVPENEVMKRLQYGNTKELFGKLQKEVF